ncbi:MAG TPA: tRNA pseudouridine(38-40) synthase TruA [Steroidobacteraceae bacterium]|jgi:tRNA pseudouridine38-40 synthase
MRRVAVGIEYDGSAYSGWQLQRHAPSVQAALEQALGGVADAPVALTCAGRTDAGVHARAQVAHFDTEAERSTRAWLLGANTHLPADISLRWATLVSEDFHARYSAQGRSYRYLILNRATRSALAYRRALVVHQPLDESAMGSAGRLLLGEHDFSAFRSSECQARSPVRELRAVTVKRSGDWIVVDVSANAFLHHMVRNIVGLLLSIGLKRAAPERAREQLQSRERSTGEATAAAHGLYLWRVDYAEQFGLPSDSAMIDAPILGWQ